VGQNRALSSAGLSERLFAHAFSGLVYAQIWEDPEVDLAAMQLEPGHKVVTIASGGCNALSYLIADPARVEAVDLNAAHVAFGRLKLAAAIHLPDCQSFRRFYGGIGGARNIEAYERFVRPRLDAETLAYWESRRWNGRRRISMFSGDLYRHGLLGLFIGCGHRAARLYGVDLRDMFRATSLAEQRDFFDSRLAPLFEKPLIRWLTSMKSTLFGLGIPPQQYKSLAGVDGGDMAAVLRERLRRLACDFPLTDNYFAWQAFARGYGDADDAPLPPYLQCENFERVRERAGRMTVAHASYTDFLAAKPDASIDRFVLLDAQDWMSDAQLNELWREITRTAAPAARVIFRTAAAPSLLPGRVGDALLSRWQYRAEESLALHARDRSAIYGGFHLYVLRDARR
jgi:S-adenosylmethionine-diacylglycerol 3-amino-3-carboxypropyl transferase